MIWFKVLFLLLTAFTGGVDFILLVDINLLLPCEWVWVEDKRSLHLIEDGLFLHQSEQLSVLPGLCLFTPIILILDPSEVTPSAPIRPGTNSNIPIFGFTKWKQKLTVECWETIPIMKRKGQIVNFSQKQNFAFHFSVGPRIIVTNWVCRVTKYHYSWWPVSLCD